MPMNIHKKEKVENAKKLMDDLCPPWCSPETPDRTNAQGDPFLDEPFDGIELDHALSMINLSSAPGLDGIDYLVLFKMSSFSKSILLDILSKAYQGKVFFVEWKQILVHFVPKQNSDKVRPISLSSCTLKLFESMVSNRFTG